MPKQAQLQLLESGDGYLKPKAQRRLLMLPHSVGMIVLEVRAVGVRTEDPRHAILVRRVKYRTHKDYRQYWDERPLQTTDTTVDYCR